MHHSAASARSKAADDCAASPCFSDETKNSCLKTCGPPFWNTRRTHTHKRTNYNNQKPPFEFRQQHSRRETERRSRTHGALPTWSGDAVQVSAGPAAGPLCGPGPCTNTRKTHARASRERRTAGWFVFARHLRVRLCAVDGRFHQRRSSHGSVKAASNTLALAHSHTPRARRGAGAQHQHTRRELQVYMLTKWIGVWI